MLPNSSQIPPKRSGHYLPFVASETVRSVSKQGCTRSRCVFSASTIAPEDKSGGGRLTPNRAGTYPLTCSHFLHTTFGMKGTIVVQ